MIVKNAFYKAIPYLCVCVCIYNQNQFHKLMLTSLYTLGGILYLHMKLSCVKLCPGAVLENAIHYSISHKLLKN